jgi:anti-anti-sigma factor
VRGTFKARGEIDMATAAAFDRDISATIDDSYEAIVAVDCLDLTFLDSAGYHVLVDMTAYAVRRGHTLVIQNLSERCATVLRLCDGDGELHVNDHGRRRLTTTS